MTALSPRAPFTMGHDPHVNRRTALVAGVPFDRSDAATGSAQKLCDDRPSRTYLLIHCPKTKANGTDANTASVYVSFTSTAPDKGALGTFELTPGQTYESLAYVPSGEIWAKGGAADFNITCYEG